MTRAVTKMMKRKSQHEAAPEVAQKEFPSSQKRMKSLARFIKKILKLG